MTVHTSKIRMSDTHAVGTFAKSRGPYALGLKRVLDVLVVTLALPVLIPFFIIVSALVALDGHNPFFFQERIGREGRRFKIWKFRTMVPNAEASLKQYLAENPKARAEWETKQKLANDPRITRVGRVLRRTSVDELPQLINVLFGSMSLVGPRPMMPCQQALYPGHGYYNLRPGLTGSWQVSARHTSDFAERAVYDDAYEADVTFANDARILSKTVGVVLRCTGA